MGSGFQPCPLRGSRGNSDTARAIAGAERFTAQGSGGAGVGVGGDDAAAWLDGLSTEVLAEVVVVDASGVLETVESPEPQPASAATATPAIAEAVRRFPTSQHGTGSLTADRGATRTSERDVR